MTTPRCGWMRHRRLRSTRCLARRLRPGSVSRPYRRWRRPCAMRFTRRRRSESARCRLIHSAATGRRSRGRCLQHAMSKKIAAFIILYCSLASAQAPSLSFVPPTRLAHLRHGINLSEWFAQVWDSKGYTKEHFETWTTASDIALIKSAGFDHVRLSVNPQPMMDAAHRSNGSDEYFGYLDAAMKMILDAGLAVELDMHPDSDFKVRLAKEDDSVERFAD